MATAPRYRYTVEECLALERGSNTRHAYFDGEIFAMAGANDPHVAIVTNLVGELRLRLKGRRCRIYSTDMRLKASPTGLYTYPDLMVVCGEIRFTDDRRDMIENPQVIAEVLSPSIEDYDRGPKFEHYRRIASVTDYLLVSQDARHVEHRARQADGTWQTTLVESDGGVPLPAIGCELPLDEIYSQVELPA